MAAQVLVRLGGHLNQVRQQVLQRLHGFQGEDEPGSIRAVQQPVLLSRIDAVERRLSILEQRVGTRPDLRELDRELAQSLARGEHGVGDRLLREFKRTLILRSLAHTGGHRLEAAQWLGWGRNTLTRKIQELGLEPELRKGGGSPAASP